MVDAQAALEHLAQAQDLRQRPVAALQPRQALVDEQVDLRTISQVRYNTVTNGVGGQRDSMQTAPHQRRLLDLVHMQIHSGAAVCASSCSTFTFLTMCSHISRFHLSLLGTGSHVKAVQAVRQSVTPSLGEAEHDGGQQLPAASPEPFRSEGDESTFALQTKVERINFSLATMMCPSHRRANEAATGRSAQLHETATNPRAVLDAAWRTSSRACR